LLSSTEKDGVRKVNRFFPESFDRILLDPPCSALGLRPKLQIVQADLHALTRAASYQQKFVKEAIQLLKRGGILTYSTCTIHGLENEAMVRHILDEYPCMHIVPVFESTVQTLGRSGLDGFGLNARERTCVCRFDPTDKGTDSMGFFIAKFKKL
jgi:16S rRNA C967 or C1407 C5-methylase (RsmB/RsmF family)